MYKYARDRNMDRHYRLVCFCHGKHYLKLSDYDVEHRHLESKLEGNERDDFHVTLRFARGAAPRPGALDRKLGCPLARAARPRARMSTGKKAQSASMTSARDSRPSPSTLSTCGA